ncbi:MAG: methyltransferase domain-containing protein [Haliscomenobacter sp.]|nr:methyltransferase domain-containing protein [Haliscomenobacter sp.]MBK7476356.1 methyltransferase domain-containing protein [Haliscomenobacter sp.]
MEEPNASPAPGQGSWYEGWFSSPYYEILYRHRDDSEAQAFIDRLLVWLQPKMGALILDLACGKGRYARYLARKGFHVTGLDLSVNSITQAREYEMENLAFFTHDMRLPYRINYFDFTFNFFTSFGYFDQEHDDVRTLKSIALGLKKGGVFVLDFFNSAYVKTHFLGSQEKTVQGIAFKTNKYLQDNRIIKTIDFEDQGRFWHFEESVRLFELQDFERLFRGAGLRIETLFGNYQLDPFDESSSPRLILIARKP